MTTTTVKTIGSTGDYSTVQAWEDAAPANLVTADEIWQGQCQNQTFNVGNATALTVAGSTTDSTRYKELTTVAGASFRDNASVQTNALRYNTSNGAAITNARYYTGTIVVSEGNFRVSNLQLANTSGSSGVSCISGAPAFIDNCILESSANSGIMGTAGGTIKVRNCLLVCRGSAPSQLFSHQGSGGYQLTNCTVVVPSDKTAATNIFNLNSYSTSNTTKNCAFFGVTNNKTGSGTVTHTTGYTSIASPPSGLTNAAYDTTTGSGFEVTTDATRDFRIKSTSALIDVGTTDATNGPIDIAGTARPSGSAYDVGAWEYVSAGGTDGNASTAPASSTLTAPTATGSGSAQASTSPAGSTLTAPTATASASALASGALAGLTLTVPTATATGSALASGALAGATLTAPTGTASSAGHATASGAFSGVTMTAPTAAATGSAQAFASFMAAVLTAPTGTASNGEAANNAGGRKKRRIDEIRAYDDVFIPAPEVTTGTVPSDTVVDPISQGGSNPATVGPSKLAPESKPRAPRKTKAPRVVSVAPVAQVAPEPTAAVAAPEPAPVVAVAKPAPRPMMLSDMLAAESMTNEEMLAAIKMLARLHMGPQLVRSPRPQLIRGR